MKTRLNEIATTERQVLMSCVAKGCWDFTGLFEADIFVKLMLRDLRHPLAADAWFRNQLLDNTATVLKESLSGETFIEGIHPREMNFVAAVCYVEWAALQSGAEDPGGRRARWLEAVARSYPSCFGDPEELATVPKPASA
jgi:hypothetical protein